MTLDNSLTVFAISGLDCLQDIATSLFQVKPIFGHTQTFSPHHDQKVVCLEFVNFAYPQLILQSCPSHAFVLSSKNFISHDSSNEDLPQLSKSTDCFEIIQWLLPLHIHNTLFTFLHAEA